MMVRTGVLLVTAAMTFGVSPANSSPSGPVATINGSVPPATVEHLHDESKMMDGVEGDGLRHLVLQGIRRVGTRSPIHIHEIGGQTCVLSGAMTLFLEGQDSVTYGAGACYYMPANAPMSAANLGAADAHIMDIFTLPAGVPYFTALEPGWSDWPDDPMS